MLNKIIIGFCDVCKKELIYKSDYYLLWHPVTNEDKRFCSKECIKSWVNEDRPKEKSLNQRSDPSPIQAA